jgi:hypothetical protein
MAKASKTRPHLCIKGTLPQGVGDEKKICVTGFVKAYRHGTRSLNLELDCATVLGILR